MWGEKVALVTYLTLRDRQHMQLLTALMLVSVNWQLEQSRLQLRFGA